MTTSGHDVFGTGARTRILIAVAAYEQTHAAELSRVLGLGQTTVRNALDTLERAGLTMGSYAGRTRLVGLNPRFRAREELAALLERLLLTDPALMEALASVRRRPRRVGKEL